MQKKLLPLRWALLFFLSLQGLMGMAQDFRLKNSISTEQVRKIAQTALPALLQWMEPTELNLYGFSASDDFSSIMVGRPVYLTSIEDMNPAMETENASVEVKTIMLPLLLNNTARCFIYVSFEDGQWKAVGIGSRVYADKNPGLFTKTDNSVSVVVSVPQANEEFILEKSSGANVYMPLFRKSDAKRTYSLTDLLALQQESFKNNN